MTVSHDLSEEPQNSCSEGLAVEVAFRPLWVHGFTIFTRSGLGKEKKKSTWNSSSFELFSKEGIFLCGREARCV